MAPILIDERGVMKLGLIAAIVIVFVFSGGFLFGYQQANDRYVSSSEIEPLSLPAKSTSLAIDIEQQKPEVVAAGEVIDVDQPEPSKSLTENVPSANTLKTQALDSSVKKISHDIKLPAATATDNEIASKNISKAEAVLITDEVLAKAKYSIQVGMYGRLVNAEIMVDKLQSQNLHAYVTDYINKKNEVRFNVKFGYYSDKKSANAALKDYIEIKKGDGYLVNFTVDHLTHHEVASSAAKSDKKQDSGAELSSVTSLPKHAEDNLNQKEASDVDVVTAAPEVLIKNQAENSKTKLVKEADKLIYN